MNQRKFLLAGIAGGITYFFLGWLFYGILLADFMKNHAGSATGVDRQDMVFWSLILGNLFSGFLLSYIFVRWANITSAAAGAVAGAIIGFLTSAAYDFISYGVTNLSSKRGVLADIVTYTILSAIAGAVVGAVAGMGKKAAIA